MVSGVVVVILNVKENNMALKKELEYKLTALEHQLKNIKTDTARLIADATDDYSDCDIAKEYIARLAQIVGCEIPKREVRVTVNIMLPINEDVDEMDIESITVNGVDYPYPYHYDSEEV